VEEEAARGDEPGCAECPGAGPLGALGQALARVLPPGLDGARGGGAPGAAPALALPPTPLRHLSPSPLSIPLLSLRAPRHPLQSERPQVRRPRAQQEGAAPWLLRRACKGGGKGGSGERWQGGCRGCAQGEASRGGEWGGEGGEGGGAEGARGGGVGGEGEGGRVEMVDVFQLVEQSWKEEEEKAAQEELVLETVDGVPLGAPRHRRAALVAGQGALPGSSPSPAPSLNPSSLGFLLRKAKSHDTESQLLLALDCGCLDTLAGTRSMLPCVPCCIALDSGAQVRAQMSVELTPLQQLRRETKQEFQPLVQRKGPGAAYVRLFLDTACPAKDTACTTPSGIASTQTLPENTIVLLWS